jgi:hypothetical protein
MTTEPIESTGWARFTDLSPVIHATTRWLLSAYPPLPGFLSFRLAEAQVRPAVAVAARLRYPTDLDAGLLLLTGTGGAGRLDWLTGSDVHPTPGEPWRAEVDEVLASWAAALLTDADLVSAAIAVAPVAEDLDRLTAPDARDLAAAADLRHPERMAAITALHLTALEETLAAAGYPGW